MQKIRFKPVISARLACVVTLSSIVLQGWASPALAQEQQQDEPDEELQQQQQSTEAQLPGAEQMPDETPASGFGDASGGGDFLAVGFGLALSPTYAGSNNYAPFALPVALGSYRGVRINPRGAGLALDFVSDPANGIGLDAGLVGRIRVDRVGRIGDEVVELLDELDTAIELGPTVGVRFPQVLNPYDSLTVNFDVLRDLNGAHGGFVFAPNFNYATPLGPGVFANLAVSTEYSSARFQNYYFRITPEDSLRSGLPAFEPGGAGFSRVGAALLLAFDLDGNLRNGGWSVVSVVGYARVLGDAASNPMTTVRGNPNQLLGAIGIGYIF